MHVFNLPARSSQRPAAACRDVRHAFRGGNHIRPVSKLSIQPAESQLRSHDVVVAALKFRDYSFVRRVKSEK